MTYLIMHYKGLATIRAINCRFQVKWLPTRRFVSFSGKNMIRKEGSTRGSGEMRVSCSQTLSGLNSELDQGPRRDLSNRFGQGIVDEGHFCR